MNSLFWEVSSPEWLALYTGLSRFLPLEYQEVTKRSYCNEKSHVMMELAGEMDGYRSQDIFKTKNKATQSNLQHSIAYSERCMRDYSKRNSELSNAILRQMKFLLG